MTRGQSLKRAAELTRKLRALRDTGGKVWCEEGTKLVDQPTGDGTMESWFEQNRRYPQYWLHVFYLANPEGAKALFADTVADLFSDPINEPQRRLRDLAAWCAGAGCIDDVERLDPSTIGTEWWLFYRMRAFMCDAYTLCPVWATEWLITAITERTGESNRRASIELGKRWRAITSVEQWAGLA